MSINKELKFTKWYEDNVKPEYREKIPNYFLYDEWFDNLPEDLRNTIIEIEKTSYDDDIFESLLEDLEVEIKEYVNNKYNGNYNSSKAMYLSTYDHFCNREYNEYYEKLYKKEVKNEIF